MNDKKKIHQKAGTEQIIRMSAVQGMKEGKMSIQLEKGASHKSKPIKVGHKK